MVTDAQPEIFAGPLLTRTLLTLLFVAIFGIPLYDLML
jgi:hypothetical protein